MNKVFNYAAVLLLALFFVGCEKVDSDVVMPERPHVGSDDPEGEYSYFRNSSEGKLRDSVYFFTYYFYLWQDQLPRSFAVHNYRTADGLLEALKGYARDGDGVLVDRFSFLDRAGTINQELQEGVIGSFGFDIRYYTETDLYVKKVDLGSPAYQAGMRRGWRITEVNGRRDLSLASMEQDNFQFLFDAIYGDQVQLKVKNPAGLEQSIQLQAAQFSYKPIITHQIFDLGPQKVGYLAFDAFTSLSLIRTQLDGIINSFEAAGVKKLIFDLRYNGGGDVATANYISNLLVPSSAHTKLMNYYKINSTLQMEGWDLFLFYPSYYNKLNSLELERIYFLVTGGSASASELLINNLSPYVDVKLVGDSRTYGKPVGYFGWDIMGVDLYAVSFQTFNADHEGDYFDGLPVDKLVGDDLSRDFGDPLEWMTAEALYHAEHGSFPASSMLQQSLGKGVPQTLGRDLNKVLDRQGRKDMFDFRKTDIDTLKFPPLQ